MSSSAKNFLWIGLTFAIALSLIWQFFPLPDASKRMNKLPLYGPSFLGNNVELTPFEAKIFKGVNVLKRVYIIGNKPYFISVIDGTNNRHVVHDPYYCFHGAGWDVKSDVPFPIPGGEARLVELIKGNERQEALYWFTDGKSKSGSAMFYWWRATLRRLTFGRFGEEPILVVVQPMEKDRLPWSKLVELFPQLFQL